MRHCTRHLIALALVAVMSPRAQAVDLVDVWRAALGHDAELAAARAARDAGEARRTQADTLWRPAVVLDAGAGIATNETSVQGARFSAPGFGQTTGVAFDTSVTNGTSGRVAVALRQPLISRGREVQQRQLEISADIAETQWQEAQQSLILRGAESDADPVDCPDAILEAIPSPVAPRTTPRRSPRGLQATVFESDAPLGWSACQSKTEERHQRPDRRQEHGLTFSRKTEEQRQQRARRCSSGSPERR